MSSKQLRHFQVRHFPVPHIDDPNMVTFEEKKKKQYTKIYKHKVGLLCNKR